MMIRPGLQTGNGDGWDAPLARRINLTGPPNQLITLADARAMILHHVAAEKQRRKVWQSAGRRLVAAAREGRAELIAAATKQMELALLLDGRLRMRR
jgi:hypothetical protein